MSIKILTKNSVDNTNIDGARQNHFNAGMRSGVVKGALNECNVTSPASNQIVINTGELRISGHQIVIEEIEQLKLTNNPQTATDYSIIAEISVNDLSVPSFRIFIQPQNSGLVQDNLFTLLNGTGTYQIKLANFTQNTDGSIFNLERVADLISGITKEQIESAIDVASNALSQSNAAIDNSNTAISKATTALDTANNAVSMASTAENNSASALSNSQNALDKAAEALDRTVEGAGTKVTVAGSAKGAIEFTADPQTQLDNKLDKSGGAVGSLTFDKAGTGFTFVTKDNVQYFVYGDGVNYSRLYLQIKDKDGNYQYYPLLDENGKLYSNKKEVLNTDGGTLTGYINVGTNYGLEGTTASGGKFDIFKLLNSTRLQVGGSYPSLELRGKDSKPKYFAGSSTTGVDIVLSSDMADRIIETYISPDGNTWYRKWESGWKECGFNLYGNGETWAKRTLRFPSLTFTDVNTFNVQISMYSSEDSGNAIAVHSGAYFNKTTSSIDIYCDNGWRRDVYICGY